MLLNLVDAYNQCYEGKKNLKGILNDCGLRSTVVDRWSGHELRMLLLKCPKTFKPSPTLFLPHHTACLIIRWRVANVLGIWIHMMLLLLSHVSRVRLCALPSLGFSRQEHWSGLPFPSPVHEGEKWKWSRLSHVQLFVTPWTVAYQAPPSMGFPRQEYWSGVPLLSLEYTWY